MIITISGMPGSGKSTVAKILARRLRMKRYYVGMMRRKMAREKGMTLAEFNKLGEKEDWTDRKVDEYQKKLGEKEDNFVIEGRTSFFLIPQSVKVFLDVDMKVGAKRIFDELKKGECGRNEGEFRTLAEAEKSVIERHTSDVRRYKKYYGVDITDKSQYDMIIDTSRLTPAQAVKKIIAEIKKLKK